MNPEPTPDGGEEAKFGPRILLQWFVFPMLVVALCVGLYLSFSFLTTERKTSQDYLNDLKSGNPHRAWQAAFALANQVNLGRIDESEKPGVGRQILRMLNQSSPGAGQIRQYMILTLGRLGHTEAVPKLIEIVRGADAAEKIYALLALRDMKAAGALEAATEALDDRDPGVRKTAVYFFGPFLRSDPELASTLTPLLNDPVSDVRWNAALSLAESVHPAAVPVLGQMLDREVLTAELGKNPPLDEANVEKILKIALAAASQFQDESLREKIRRMAAEDPNLHVQAAARGALERAR
ncbi:HEAT repeat domain-containing protein [bacterium]|nr:HEAT repeat domain-containing protein [bacterium]